MTDIDKIVEYEGLNVQEAKLSYAERKDLPNSAFCGPDRTYPAQDSAHVRNGLARLATFGGRLPEAIRKKIYLCLVRRAKKFGVEHDPKNYKWGKYITESKAIDAGSEKLVQWYLNELGITKK
jgi:hypothetical protein